MNEDTENSILIIDDETSNLIYLSQLLHRDYVIYTTKNGKEAVNKAIELKPDLILLDILMPEMNGYEVLSRLKLNEETKKIPVIFISGLDSNEDEEKGLALGTSDYIHKPFNAGITKLRINNQIQIINQMRSIEQLNYNLEKTVMERTSELQLQTKTAQTASMAKSTFLATMSHEFKTPLNAIIGMAGIARNAILNMSEPQPGKKNNTAELRENNSHWDKALISINQIVSSSHHLLSILNDVLDMSKIEFGKLELTYKPFRTVQAYNEFAAMIEHNCLAKKIKFTTDINEMEDIEISGDMPRLNQVLASLLNNAIKFTPEGGEISLSVKVIQENKTNIKYRFSVSDTGIGMTGEQMERLFKPFEQINIKISEKFGGIGLGLAISQNIIKMMGGEIKAESEIDKGSRFYFDLIYEKTNSNTAATQYEYEDLSGKRILLVDDIEINRMIIYEMLSSAGIFLDEAENGQRAVEMFAESSWDYYDLIIMDIKMPVMNGYEAAEKIRSMDRPDSKSIPIIALTANTFQDDINKALASGMNDHLSKPIDIKIIMDTLDKYINSKTKTA